MAQANTLTKRGIIGRSLQLSWQLRPWAFAGYFLGAILEIAATITTIYATAQLGNLLARYATGKPTNKIWFWLVVDLVAAVAIGIAFWLMGFTKRFMYYSTVRWSIDTYMKKLCYLDYPDLYKKHVRNMINKVDSGASWQIAALGDQTLELVYGIIRFFAITLVVSQISWWIVPVIVVFLLPSLVAESRMARLIWFVWDEKGDERQIFFGLFYLFRQAREQLEVRSMQTREYLIQKVTGMNQGFYTRQEAKYRQASKRVVLAKVLEVGGIAIGSIVLIKRFLAGTIGFNSYLFLSGALLRVGGALNAVFGTISHLQEPILYAQTFFELADYPIRMTDAADAIPLTSTRAPQIDCVNLSFKYPDTDRLILDNLELSIKPGEHVAIVGENGAGKSTLIKLLLRFYQPTGGSINIDGHDLRTIQIESWYARLATLFQSFSQYPFPVKENISLSTHPNQQRLDNASKLSGVDSIVQDLPKGYDTVLDATFKDGIEPSGGQYQRVALARAFYRDASLLILDEPTAAIDAKAEYDIFNNIFDHYKDKTAIIVSHRFSTVRRADRIVVLDQGRIIEQGSHTELMKHKGLYHEMFSKQAEGYK